MPLMVPAGAEGTVAGHGPGVGRPGRNVRRPGPPRRGSAPGVHPRGGRPLRRVLLLLVFRSVLVPLKAAAMNLLSVGAAYGVLVMVFQWGWGRT